VPGFPGIPACRQKGTMTLSDWAVRQPCRSD